MRERHGVEAAAPGADDLAEEVGASHQHAFGVRAAPVRDRRAVGRAESEAHRGWIRDDIRRRELSRIPLKVFEGVSGRYSNVQWLSYRIRPCLESLGDALREVMEDVLPRLQPFPVRLSMQYQLVGDDESGRWYRGHEMTGLSTPTTLENKRVAAAADLMDMMEAFVVDREGLEELYRPDDIDADYRDVKGLRFRLYRPEFQDYVGDLHTRLLQDWLLPNEAPPRSRRLRGTPLFGNDSTFIRRATFVSSDTWSEVFRGLAKKGIAQHWN